MSLTFKATARGGRALFGEERYKVGKNYHVDGTPKLCEWGYHASWTIEDAFKYNDGPEVYEVELSGSTDVGWDKICASDMFVKRKLSDLEVIDTMKNKHMALRWAARNGMTHIVEMLLTTVDPKADQSKALACAASCGHTACVKSLIPASDPKAMDSWALRHAAGKGRTECVRLLIPVSDPDVVRRLGLA